MFRRIPEKLTFKATAILVSFSFMLTSFVSCSNKRATNEQSTVQSTNESQSIQVVLDGPKLKSMVDEALADTKLQAFADSLSRLGYIFDSEGCFSFVRDTAGKQQQLIGLYYLEPVEFSRSAYIFLDIQSNGQRTTGVIEYLVNPEADEPMGGADKPVLSKPFVPPADFEQMSPQIWHKPWIDAVPHSTNRPVRDHLACLEVALGACVFSIIPCVHYIPGCAASIHCILICCGVEAAVAYFSCMAGSG